MNAKPWKHACVRLMQVLTDSTWEAIRLGLTEKFLAEGQPDIGRNGHVLSVITHRYLLLHYPALCWPQAFPPLLTALWTIA